MIEYDVCRARCIVHYGSTNFRDYAIVESAGAAADQEANERALKDTSSHQVDARH